MDIFQAMAELNVDERRQEAAMVNRGRRHRTERRSRRWRRYQPR
jgi:hypothetical protein